MRVLLVLALAACSARSSSNGTNTVADAQTSFDATPGSDVTVDAQTTLDGPGPAGCTPGRVKTCPCPGTSASGSQTCQRDGTFGACVCSMSDASADSVALDAPADASDVYPPGPYRTSVCGRFRPFTLNRCDGTPWRFDGADFFTSTATLIIFSAAWSVPNQMLAAMIETQLGRYRDRGVRIVEVLVQNPDRTAITGAFCSTWTARYHLTIPELMDPDQTLAAYFPSLAFPAMLVVDRHAVIRSFAYGTSSGLSMIQAMLDDTLASPDTCP